MIMIRISSAAPCRSSISILNKKFVWKAAAAVFWLIVWTVLAHFVSDILFAGPMETLQSLLRMAGTGAFWQSIAHSLWKIVIGFALAFGTGTLLAILCAWCRPAGLLLSPAVQIMKSVPVACFVTVALIWMHSTQISVLVSFFVFFPITFINLSEGLAQRDRALFEMAKVFRVPMGKQLRYLYIPQVMPFLLSGCRVSVGMAWKSGVAGEIIGLTNASIGEQLYLSKLYLNIDDLFAWTIVIICISLLCERAVVALLERLQRRWENAYGNSL